MEQSDKNEPLTNQLINMEVGRQLAFPAERLNVVRVTACDIGFKYGRRYTTRTDRENRTVTVTRTE